MAVEIGGGDRLAGAEELDTAVAGDVEQNAARPDRESSSAPPFSGPKSPRSVRAEPPCQRCSSPTVMCASASMCAPECALPMSSSLI